MTTILSEGVIVPDAGDVNWAGKLEVNWNLLNGALANLSGNVKTDRDNTWTGEQSFTLPIVGSITGTAAKAIADEDGTSIKTGYGKLAGNQTWTGVNTFSAGLQTGIIDTNSGNTDLLLRSTDQTWENGARIFLYSNTHTGQTNGSIYIDVDHGDENNTKTGLTLIPNAFHPIGGTVNTTYGVSLGTATYQWAKVYAQTYYYNGTAWGLDKVNEWSETNVFTKAYSDATYSAIFGFSNLTSVHTSPLAVFFDVRGSSNYASYGAGLWAGYVSTGSVRYGHLKFVRTTDKRGETNSGTILDTDFSFIDMAFHYSMINFMESVRITNDGTENSLKPITNNATDLGTSTNKWKTINGINPGALSLPDYNSTAKINISGSITPDQYGNIYYTPTINGWLYVCFDISSASVTTGNSIFYIQAKDSNVANSNFVQTSWMPTSGGTSSLSIFFPVVANKQFIMQINFSNYTIIKAHVIPCLGNV